MVGAVAFGVHVLSVLLQLSASARSLICHSKVQKALETENIFVGL